MLENATINREQIAASEEKMSAELARHHTTEPIRKSHFHFIYLINNSSCSVMADVCRKIHWYMSQCSALSIDMSLSVWLCIQTQNAAAETQSPITTVHWSDLLTFHLYPCLLNPPPPPFCFFTGPSKAPGFYDHARKRQEWHRTAFEPSSLTSCQTVCARSQ